jgi:hypothetical protein
MVQQGLGGDGTAEPIPGLEEVDDSYGMGIK